MRRFLRFFFLVSLFLFSSCGSVVQNIFDSTIPTQTEPFVSRVDPSTVGSGNTVAVFGRGFSLVAGLNIITIDSVEVAAASYELVEPATPDEIEKLTFTVPSGLSAGTHTLSVFVIDNPSNANVAITIN